MLRALLCALQLAASTQTQASLTVRVGDKAREVPIVAMRGGAGSVRADLLAEAMGGQLIPLSATRYRFVLDERQVTIEVGIAFARTDSSNLPMLTAPYRAANQLYVPVSLVTELLPRVFNGLMYDDDKGELRRFALVKAPKVASGNAPPTGVPARGGTGSTTAKGTTQSTNAGTPVAPKNAMAVRRHVVVIDAGHGGPDKGMSGPLGNGRKVNEKDITLAVALALQQQLEARGVTVVMTRRTDTLIALGDRGRIANTAKGDLFISVHVNAANPGWTRPATARGFETYFLAEAKTEDEKRVEAMENESIRFETSAETTTDDPLGFIIRDMAQNEHLRESSTLASLIHARLKAMHPGPSRGVKQAGFSVLVHAFMPAVLVEIGFGSNVAESAYMADKTHQGELASAIADGAIAYLQQYERKVGGTTP